MFMGYRCWQTFCDVMLIIGVTMGDMSCVISGLVLIQIAVDIEAYNKCETLLRYRYLQINFQVVIFVYNRRANIFQNTVSNPRCVTNSTFVFFQLHISDGQMVSFITIVCIGKM